MQSEKTCCAAAARMVKKLALPDGLKVGIANLENILKEVTDLKLVDDQTIKRELLKRVKIYNYVVPAVEADYSEALLKAYNQQCANPHREVN